MNALDSWTWPERPTDAASFDEMMSSLDQHLAIHGLLPNQRGLNAARLVSIALKLSGTPFFCKDADRGEPFSPRDLLARVFDWYRDSYGERNKIDFSLGYIVWPLRGTYWTMRIPCGYGTVQPFLDRDLKNTGRSIGTSSQPATYNVLTGIEGLTQTYASQLEHDELQQLGTAYGRGYSAMASLDEMRGHGLFDQAKGDYRHSVEALSEGRTLSKARWDNAQCAEKIFKALLDRAGHTYPKSGSKGHDIVHLGELVTNSLGVSVPINMLQAIHCPPSVRYGEVNIDMNSAWTSHAALLEVLVLLRPIAASPGQPRLRS